MLHLTVKFLCMGILYPPPPDPCYGRTFLGPELWLEPTDCDLVCEYIMDCQTWCYLNATWPDCEGLYFCILTGCHCVVGETGNGVYTAVARIDSYADPAWASEAYLRRRQVEKLGPWLAGMVRDFPPENPLTGKFEHYHWNAAGMEWLLLAHGADASNILIKYDPDDLPPAPY